MEGLLKAEIARRGGPLVLLLPVAPSPRAWGSDCWGQRPPIS